MSKEIVPRRLIRDGEPLLFTIDRGCLYVLFSTDVIQLVGCSRAMFLEETRPAHTGDADVRKMIADYLTWHPGVRVMRRLKWWTI